MKLLYKPIAIIAGLIAKRLGKSVFRSLWAAIDDAPPPVASAGDATVVKVIGAQALQAGVMAASAAAVDRAFARLFHHLIGVWPAKSPERPAADGE